MDGKENTAAGTSTSMTDNTLDTNDRVRKFWERLDQYHTATQVPGKSKDSPSGNIVGGGGGGGLNTAAHVMQEGARSPSSSPSSSLAARPDGSPGASSPATDADVVYKKVPTPIVAMSERLSRTLDELRADSMTRGPPPPPPPPRASTSCTTDESEDTSETSTYGDNDDDAEFEEEEEELEFHLEEVEDDEDDEEADDEDEEEDEEEVRHMLQSMMRDNKQMQEDVMNAIFKAKREMHARRANDMQHRQYQDARNVLLHRRPMAHDGNSDATSDDGEASIDQFPLVTSTDHNQATNTTNTTTTTTSSSLPAESSPTTQVISRFDELEQAYNRVTKILLSTRVLNESSVGLGTFPKDLPQVEKAAKFSDELDLLVEAERVLRATPPRGPTLEVLRTQHAEVVVGLSDKLHGQCDQALKDLRSVEDRMRMVDGKQRLLADRKADLVRVVKDCERLRLEIEEVTEDMRKRASQVSARELAMEDKLRSLRETEARHRARSEESEELHKTATAWVKILNEREERLNAKEERLQRIERDLLRRQEDVRLYSGAAHNNGTKAAPIQSFS